MTNATAAAKTARASNLSPVERAAYAEAMASKGKQAARERHVAEGKNAAKAKRIKAYYGEKAKEKAIATWKANKMASAAIARRAGAGTVAEQVAKG